MRVYLAGGLKSGWQDKVKMQGPDICYLDPSRHKLPSENEYTAWDLLAIRSADAVFIYFEADNPSGFGLSIEAGFAYALGKVVVYVDEKSQADPEAGKRLGMLRTISSVVFDSLDDGIAFLHSLALIP